MVFAKFIKKLQLPSEYTEAAQDVFGDAQIVLTATNSAKVKPGDIITFSYPGSMFSSRRLLVVGTKHAPRAKYMSGRGNYLLCCFELEETLPGIAMIFNSFYKNRTVNYSRMPKTLNNVFGVKGFKTFNIQKITSLFEVTVKRDTK